MAYDTIKYEVAEQILTITLNRPDKLNAFNAAMQKEMIDASDQADKDDNIRAIIVTGAGRGFCAGADLSSGADTFDRDARRGPAKRVASSGVDYLHPHTRGPRVLRRRRSFFRRRHFRSRRAARTGEEISQWRCRLQRSQCARRRRPGDVAHLQMP